MTLAKLTCLLLLLAGPVDDRRSLIEEALDQVTQLDIESIRLTVAFDTIVRDTGVEVRVSEQTLDLLPYGRNTRINARIQNVSLREGLVQLTAPLGLRFEVNDRGIELLPTAPLLRIGRRATWDELDTLAELRAQRFPADRAAIDRWAKRLQFQVGQPDPWPALHRAIIDVGAGAGDEVLTLACDSLGWTWYPSGQHVAIVRQVDQQLRQVISLRQTSRKLIDVLQTIGQKAGVPIRCQPGAIAALPPQTRSNFSLYAENKSLGDVLQLVAATTGLGYNVESDAIVFYQPTGQAPRPTDPYVGKIVLPPGPDGAHIELLIHESDLSPEVNQLRQRHLQRADQTIREALLRLEEPIQPPND